METQPIVGAVGAIRLFASSGTASTRRRSDTERNLSEKSHLMMLVFGVMSAGFAVAIGWTGWAIYLTAGNVLVNLYPILLQRYTRARLCVVLRRRE